MEGIGSSSNLNWHHKFLSTACMQISHMRKDLHLL